MTTGALPLPLADLGIPLAIVRISLVDLGIPLAAVRISLVDLGALFVDLGRGGR